MRSYVLLLFVFSVQNLASFPNGLIQASKTRKIRQSRWSWGYEEDEGSKSNEETTIPPHLKPYIWGNRKLNKSLTTTTESNENNPCIEQKVPDFSGPGRRISQVKCYEFIWDIKNREGKPERKQECWEYTIRKEIEALGYQVGPLPKPAGGRPAFYGEFPHMAGIGWKASIGKWIFKCGGSLISSRFVLTAAHCTKLSPLDRSVLDPVPKIVSLGDKDIILDVEVETFAELGNISRIIVHPQYHPPKKYFDIALFELEEDVEFSIFVQPACLWGRFDTSSLGTHATATGWGVIETKKYTLSPNLQVIDIDVIGSRLCDRLLGSRCGRNWCGLMDNQICAGNLSGGVDTCQGDSGGPLQVKINLPPSDQGQMHYVIGVTSFGVGCARPNTPGIYTRVSSFIGWIERIVWP